MPAPFDRRQEQAIVLLVAAVQFINTMDFTIVMPLGSFFRGVLHIDPAKIGYIAGAYTAAAAVTGFAGSFVLDRFDRRTALGVSMLGLVAGTAMGGLAGGLGSLLLARIVAGAFGGPATSISLSIVTDVVPDERRGRAMGVVIAALSMAQILGIPAGLWLAQWRWNMPFFGLAAFGLVVSAAAVALLPSLTGHRTAERPAYLALFHRPVVVSSYSLTALMMFGAFLIVPNIPGFAVNNLGLAKEQLRWFYLIAGLASIVAVFLSGRAIDRYGSFLVGTIGTVLVSAVVYGTLSVQWPIAPVVFAICLSASFAMRNVAHNTLTSKVPRSMERAQFQSLQSTVRHLASATGAVLSSALLTVAPDGRLSGTNRLALFFLAASALLPFLLWRVERVLAHERAAVVAAG